MLERATITEIGGDACRAERVVSDRRMDARRCSAPADHAPSVRLRHRSVSKRHGVMARAGSKEPAFAIVTDTRGIDVGAQHLGKRVMARHRVLLAAFLVKLHLPACTLRSKILRPSCTALL